MQTFNDHEADMLPKPPATIPARRSYRDVVVGGFTAAAATITAPQIATNPAASAKAAPRRLCPQGAFKRAAKPPSPAKAKGKSALPKDRESSTSTPSTATKLRPPPVVVRVAKGKSTLPKDREALTSAPSNKLITAATARVLPMDWKLPVTTKPPPPVKGAWPVKEKGKSALPEDWESTAASCTVVKPPPPPVVVRVAKGKSTLPKDREASTSAPSAKLMTATTARTGAAIKLRPPPVVVRVLKGEKSKLAFSDEREASAARSTSAKPRPPPVVVRIAKGKSTLSDERESSTSALSTTSKPPPVTKLPSPAEDREFSTAVPVRRSVSAPAAVEGRMTRAKAAVIAAASALPPLMEELPTSTTASKPPPPPPPPVKGKGKSQLPRDWKLPTSAPTTAVAECCPLCHLLKPLGNHACQRVCGNCSKRFYRYQGKEVKCTGCEAYCDHCFVVRCHSIGMRALTKSGARKKDKSVSAVTTPVVTEELPPSEGMPALLDEQELSASALDEVPGSSRLLVCLENLRNLRTRWVPKTRATVADLHLFASVRYEPELLQRWCPEATHQFLFHRYEDGASGVAAFVAAELDPRDMRVDKFSSTMAFTVTATTVSGQQQPTRARVRYLPWRDAVKLQTASRLFLGQDDELYGHLPAIEFGDANIPEEGVCRSCQSDREPFEGLSKDLGDVVKASWYRDHCRNLHNFGTDRDFAKIDIRRGKFLPRSGLQPHVKSAEIWHSVFWGDLVLYDVDPANLGPPCYPPPVSGGEQQLFCLFGTSLYGVADGGMRKVGRMRYSSNSMTWSIDWGRIKPLDESLPKFGTLQAAAEFRHAVYAGDCRIKVTVQLDPTVANYMLLMDPPASPVCWTQCGLRHIQLCGETQTVMALAERLVEDERQLKEEDIPEEFRALPDHHVDPSTLAAERCSFCLALGYSHARMTHNINV